MPAQSLAFIRSACMRLAAPRPATRARRVALVSLLGASVACVGPFRAAPPAPTNGLEVLRAMRIAYDGRWYKTLTFTQKTVLYAPNGKTTEQIWLESLRHVDGTPTQLRIDVGDLAQGNGVIYTADSVFQFRGGKLAARSAGGNALLPLIEGAYVQPVERTVAELAPTKVNFERPVVNGTWDGRPVWIVGAASASDTTSPQFWIDTENKMLLRAIFVPAPNAPQMDMRLGAVRPAGGGLLATRCDFYVQGRLVQTEEYTEWQAGRELPAALFDPAQWSTAPHWGRTAGASGAPRGQ